jgi:hypothetical protein
MTGKRYAIIVGSNNYERNTPLWFTIDDAKDIKDILIKRCLFSADDIELLLFEPHNKENNVAKIDAAFEKIKKVFKKGKDSFLFYFSGHGKYDKNAKTSTIILSDTEKYSLKELYSKMTKEVKGKHSYMIIDACEVGASPKNFSDRKQERKINHHFKGVYCLFGATEKTLSYEPTLNQSEKMNIKNGFLTHFLKEALNYKGIYLGEKSNTNINLVTGYIQQRVKEIVLPYFEQVPKAIIESIGDDEFAFWDEKEEIEEHKDIIVTKPLKIIEENENEVMIKDYEEGITYNSAKKPIITIASSYFFHNRIRDAFEQKQGLKVVSDLQEAVARLEICLKDPIVFHNDYNNEKEKQLYEIYDNPYKKVVTQPIWLFRNGAISIKKFEKLSPTKFLLYSNFSKYGTNSCYEIELSKLATFISWNRHQCFIYIEVKAEQPYQEGYADKRANGIEETQILYDGEPLPTKEEDNFRIYRNDELIELSSAKKEERTHYIQKYNFIIGEQFSKWDNYSGDLDKILREEITLEEFVKKVKNKKPSDVDW